MVSYNQKVISITTKKKVNGYIIAVMVNYGESIIIKKVKKKVHGRGMIHMAT